MRAYMCGLCDVMLATHECTYYDRCVDHVDLRKRCGKTSFKHKSKKKNQAAMCLPRPKKKMVRMSVTCTHGIKVQGHSHIGEKKNLIMYKWVVFAFCVQGKYNQVRMFPVFV